MSPKEFKILKDSVKSVGSWGAFRKILQGLNEESLKTLKTTQDYRYYQARVNTLEEIISLLPEVSE